MKNTLLHGSKLFFFTFFSFVSSDSMSAPSMPHVIEDPNGTCYNIAKLKNYNFSFEEGCLCFNGIPVIKSQDVPEHPGISVVDEEYEEKKQASYIRSFGDLGGEVIIKTLPDEFEFRGEDDSAIKVSHVIIKVSSKSGGQVWYIDPGISYLGELLQGLLKQPEQWSSYSELKEWFFVAYPLLQDLLRAIEG